MAKIIIVSDEKEVKEDNSLSSLMEKYDKKKTVEETHKRRTFLIRRELINRIDEIAKDKPKGFVTDLVNTALDSVITQLENKKVK
ncbi:hypothetical protein [Bacillus sp. CDB3]|uniref:hypothetical protein n=1 Tax=Bacillus sp. CDB3 TaxID=360310 RepID=UPI0009D8D0BC|nr:hypothetical protein [Bacillus sp. CDB3]OQR53157.1 hypothetical protein CDB3_31660 [Bacillus sp. CDB3]